MEKRLYRDEARQKVGGVCAGLADYLNVDVTMLRVVFLLALIFLKGLGGLIYIVLWIVLPKKIYPIGTQPQQPFTNYTPPTFNQPFVDYTVPPVPPVSPNTDFSVPPVAPLPKKGPSTGGLIAGVALTLLGVFILLDNLNIMPDWDFEHLWPLILIAVGCLLLILGFNKPKQAKDKPLFDQPENTTDSNPLTEQQNEQ